MVFGGPPPAASLKKNSSPYPLFRTPSRSQDEFLSQDEDPVYGDPIDEDAKEVGPSSSAAAAAAPPSGPAAMAQAFLTGGRFDKAVAAFSSALKCSETKECRIGLLLGRAAAYCGLSRHIRGIPAAESEARAMYAPDPSHLAGSALRDADNALRLDAPRIAAAHAARGDALFLLERYHDARASYRLAIDHAPGQLQYGAKLAECEQALGGGVEAEGGGEGEAGQVKVPCANSYRAIR